MLANTKLDLETEMQLLAQRETVARRHGPYEAAIQGSGATWHALTVAPNCDRSAAGHLVGRRFGIYLPEVDGPRPGLREPLLPGYLFVFVWGIADHVGRILGCPGVIDFLRMSGQIITIPDAIIDQIREIENRERPILLPSEVIDMAAGGARRKRKKRWRKSRQIQHTTSAVIGGRPYSPTIDAKGLDADGRIGAFLAAIGVGPDLQPSRLVGGG